jgi:hypothetical protein
MLQEYDLEKYTLSTYGFYSAKQQHGDWANSVFIFRLMTMM